MILKEENAATPNKYRPMSLRNVIYKVIIKVIANRLKPLFPMLISQKQTGYVEGREILDSIILAHEVTHSLIVTRQLGMLLKMDLSKYFHKLSL